MAELPFNVSLTRVADGTPVTARIVRLTREMAKNQIDGQWWTNLGVSRSARDGENDHRWSWRTEVGSAAINRWTDCVAVATDDDEVQGGMILRLDARSFVDESAGAVNIYALSTAPRNRGWLVQEPVFRGAGTALLEYAILTSYELGLGGRIILYSFDEPRTKSFYRKLGFDVVADPNNQSADLMMELAPQAAGAFLGKAGYKL